MQSTISSLTADVPLATTDDLLLFSAEEVTLNYSELSWRQKLCPTLDEDSKPDLNRMCSPFVFCANTRPILKVINKKKTPEWKHTCIKEGAVNCT